MSTSEQVLVLSTANSAPFDVPATVDLHFAVDGGGPLWTDRYNGWALPAPGTVLQVDRRGAFRVLGEERWYSSSGRLGAITVWLLPSPGDARPGSDAGETT